MKILIPLFFTALLVLCSCTQKKTTTTTEAPSEIFSSFGDHKIKLTKGTVVSSATTKEGEVIYRMINANTTSGLKCSCSCKPHVCQTEVEIDGSFATCTGTCSGVASDGSICAGCGFKIIQVPVNMKFNQVLSRD